MKRCTSCGVEKSLAENFRLQKAANRPNAYYSSWCRQCHGAYVKKYQSSPGYQKAKRRKQVLKLYGLNADVYQNMMDAQGSACAICRGTEASGKHLAVDHCHSTGRVRGLLCSSCNQTLGKMKDSPALLRAAASYLEK